MDEKLTLGNILKYNKAEIIPASEGEWSGWIKSIDLEHKTLIVSLKGFYPEVSMCINISDCKLILRDISELTDEEKIHIERFIPKKFIDYTIAEIIRECSSSKLIELVDYLRSINVDIDGYIASGKAVKE